MKKLLSIVLAVAVMASLSISASAAEVQSLLPDSADKFTCTAAGNEGTEEVTVTASGDGFKFESTAGWPSADYAATEEGSHPWITVNQADDVYLNYDFEVVSGATNVIVYFCGQSPKDQAAPGAFVCINGLVDAKNVNSLTGDAVADLPVGKYQGSVKVGDLKVKEDLIVDGNFIISGCKVFAVGGTTIVNNLSVGEKLYGATAGNNDGGAKATTTTAKKGGATTTTPKTADTTESMLFVVVAAAAVAVVTVSAVASKKAKSR